MAAVTQWPQATSDLKANPDVTFGTLLTAGDLQRVARRWLRADRAFRVEVTPAPATASVASR